MTRILFIVAILAFVGSNALGQPSGRVKSPPSSGDPAAAASKARGDILQVDADGNVVDPTCKFWASEIAKYAAENRTSRPLSKGAINHHTVECNAMRETQRQKMKEQHERDSEELEREEAESKAKKQEEAAKAKEEQRKKCIDDCGSQCQINCPAGYLGLGSSCNSQCPPRYECEKRCATP